VPLDKAWANECLSWTTRLLYDRSTWNSPHNFYCKIVVARSNIEFLEDLGFWWQAGILASHLHKAMKEFTDLADPTPMREREIHA
jgi:hypothetical protein